MTKIPVRWWKNCEKKHFEGITWQRLSIGYRFRPFVVQETGFCTWIEAWCARGSSTVSFVRQIWPESTRLSSLRLQILYQKVPEGSLFQISSLASRCFHRYFHYCIHCESFALYKARWSCRLCFAASCFIYFSLTQAHERCRSVQFVKYAFIMDKYAEV